MYQLVVSGILDAARETLTGALRRRKARSEELLRTLRYERALVYEDLGQRRRARSELEKLYAGEPNKIKQNPRQSRGRDSGGYFSLSYSRLPYIVIAPIGSASETQDSSFACDLNIMYPLNLDRKNEDIYLRAYRRPAGRRGG